MQIVSFALCFIFLVPVPFVIGSALLGAFPRVKPSVAGALLSGNLFSWALFEVVCVPLIIMKWSLNRMTVVYGGLLGLIFLISFITGVKSGILKEIWTSFADGLKRASWIGGIAILLVSLQTLILTLLRHQNGDDAEYVAMATTAWHTNTLLQIDPYTGRLWEYVYIKRVISPWSLLPAFYANVTKLHPAVIFHTMFPLILIPLCYMAYYLLGKQLFCGLKSEKDRQKAPWLFLIFVSILMVMDGFSTRMAGSMLLGRIWQGKAVVCCVIIPLLFAFLIFVQEEKRIDRIFAALIVITLAGVLASSMAVVLLTLIIAAYALTTLIRERAVLKTVAMLMGCLPCVIAGALYLVWWY